MYTGRLPFFGQTPMDVMVAHVRQRPPRLHEFFPEIPQPLESLVLSMLEKAPEKRPQSVEEVRERLEAFASDQGSPLRRASRPDQPAVRASPPHAPVQKAAEAPAPLEAPRRSPWPFVAVAAGIVVTLLIAVLVIPAPAARLEPAPVVEEPTPPQPVAATAPAKESMKIEAAAPGVEDEELAPLPSVLGKPRATPPREPPTAQALTTRLEKLEARAAKHPNLDPSALQFLGRFRIEATAAETPAQRARLARSIDEWERSFLR